MPNGSDIIIRGGSAEVEYDSAEYPEDKDNPKKHKNSSLKIVRIEITGDRTWDSGPEVSGGLNCEIRAICK
ncbi:MAG TPA: hypothetical protein VJM12_04310 [Pyrinomonadaceae bacterium]|nr:hypothetical protein [Pyrinomonadaceae bacterium]